MGNFFGLSGMNVAQIFVAAFLLRVVLMPFLFHPDIKTYSYQSSNLSRGVLNIYEYIPQHRAELSLKEEFVYFPLTYFAWGGYLVLLSPILGQGFNVWLSDASGGYINSVGTFKYIFLLKLPLLAVDLILGLLLVKMVDLSKRKLVAALWLFNPFTLIIIYGFSNVDIFPVVFSVLALMCVLRNKFILSALLLGIGAGFKAYPIILLPFVFFATQDWLKRILILVVGLGSVIAVSGYFLRSKYFVESTLASGLTTRVFSTGIDLGNGQIVSLPVLLIAIFLGFLVMSGRFRVKNIGEYFLVSLLLVLSSINYHIQWLLWVAPFAVLLMVKNTKYVWLVSLIFLVAFVIPLLYPDRALNFGLLSPISEWYLSLNTFNLFVAKFVNPNMLIGALHSILLGMVVVLALIFAREKGGET